MILLPPVDKYNIIKTKRSSLSARVCVPTTGHITRLLLSSLKCQTSPAVSLLVSLLLFSRVCSSARIYTPTHLTRFQKSSFCEIYCYNDIITERDVIHHFSRGKYRKYFAISEIFRILHISSIFSTTNQLDHFIMIMARSKGQHKIEFLSFSLVFLTNVRNIKIYIIHIHLIVFLLKKFCGK